MATGSVRRQRQLHWKRPDLKLVDVRGNVPTRLRKLAENRWDGIVLARAGLERLGFSATRSECSFEDVQFFVEILPREIFLPAGGQGIIALQIRVDDQNTKAFLPSVNDPDTLLCLQAEREFLSLLHGDCNFPVGVYATISNGRMKLRTQVFEGESPTPRLAEVDGASDEGDQLAAKLFEKSSKTESMSKSGSKNGKVYLVGAGPGHLDLVTLRAKECIENADVIVYDHLANPDALGWTRDEAEIIYAGKQPGESRTQEEINALLVEKAREGKQVVRLKGGDPFVFGRGAEEAQEIATAGVPFEIVPGITSAIAGPAYAGIPMTHRAHNSHVTFFYRSRRITNQNRKRNRLCGAGETWRHTSDAYGHGPLKSRHKRNAEARRAR